MITIIAILSATLGASVVLNIIIVLWYQKEIRDYKEHINGGPL